MKRELSKTAIREKAVGICRRFMLSTIAAITMCICMITMVAYDVWDGVLIHFLSTTYLLGLMLKLWAEEIASKRVINIAYFVSYATILIDTAILESMNDNDFCMATYVGHAAVYAALVLGIIFLPFFREKNDIKAWNFGLKLAIKGSMSFLLGLTMTLGVGVLINGFGQLFDVRIPNNTFTYVYIIFLQLLSMLTFLTMIPKGTEKHDERGRVMPFIDIATRYLFIPLVSAYCAVLYLYLLYIVTSWNLPRGTISWMVSIMMTGIIGICILLYPNVHNNQEKRLETTVLKWAPMIALPLVVLMSVGLGRRLSDYGITPNRLYMLTLNIWFYIVCIGLWYTRTRRIHWMMLSAVAILLLTSSQPLNYYRIAQWNMQDYITEQIKAYPPKRVPMQEDELKEWILSLPAEEREDTYTKLQCLKENYPAKITNGWIDIRYLYRNYSYFAGEDQKENKKLVNYVNEAEIQIPAGYSHMRNIGVSSQYMKHDSCMQGTHLKLTIDKSAEENGARYVFDIDIKELDKWDSKLPTPTYTDTHTGDSILFIPNKIWVDDNNDDFTDVQYSGYIFRK